ncbi:PepSY domain-containing protein [Priestia megaterium]|uniref:PepSY domain-containing protein n=1 Tax=Priestia megaterium TaxID=1404 RepID=UPI0021AD2F53|nr:PepSY domain-containing protein [Priestia megaterium]MCR8928868.1 PepSY domain-containing protein [Priestia megaterium]
MIGKSAMGKAIAGIALGAMIGVSGVSSSFAAETHHANSTKAVSQHQVKQYSENQARTIALKAKPGKFKSVSFHNNVYTYIIHKDGHDFKVTVNAKTGAVLKVVTLK